MAKKNLIVLTEGEHFSKSELVKYLNKEYGSKTSGKKFTRSDVQQYVTRGNLPTAYGGYEIKEVRYKHIGVLVHVKMED